MDDENDRRARRLWRLVPPTSDHCAWIELLANALGRKSGLPGASEVKKPGKKIPYLLGAYARMSPGPGCRLPPELIGT
ncbi:hypothetical protein REMIM1_PC00009 (plasmid) [Rhizobium etli bv. mimosae str. Mim1]|nr:hypothetical protein REMIM1_PC00009 [Rhizobium etli bv. mimosae str. Mim1]